MNNPPDPGFPVATPDVIAVLVADAARYRYAVTARDAAGALLGLFIDGATQKAMVMIGNGGCAVQWRIDAQSNLTPHLLSTATYEVLRGGAANPDGSIVYQGRSYRIRARWDGTHSIAEAVLT